VIFNLRWVAYFDEKGPLHLIESDKEMPLQISEWEVETQSDGCFRLTSKIHKNVYFDFIPKNHPLTLTVKQIRNMLNKR
jgi:hypothetical protein